MAKSSSATRVNGHHKHARSPMQTHRNSIYGFSTPATRSDQAQQASSLNLTGPCYPVLFASTNVFWSCQLDDAPAIATLPLWQKAGGVEVNSGNVIVQVIQKALTTPSAVAKRCIADLGRAWPVLVVCGGIAPLVLSVAYLVLVRYFVGLLTWLTIILLNALTLLVTLFFYIKAGWIGKDVVTGVIGNGADKVLSSSGYPPLRFHILQHVQFHLQLMCFAKPSPVSLHAALFPRHGIKWAVLRAPLSLSLGVEVRASGTKGARLVTLVGKGSARKTTGAVLAAQGSIVKGFEQVGLQGRSHIFQCGC